MAGEAVMRQAMRVAGRVAVFALKTVGVAVVVVGGGIVLTLQVLASVLTACD